MVLAPGRPRHRPVEDQRLHAFGICRREQHAHHRSLRPTDENAAPRPDRVHHCAHVVHPLLEPGSRSSVIGSERPVPRLSKVMMRPNELSRCHTLDACGDSQLISRCEITRVRRPCPAVPFHRPYTRSRCRRCACSECQRSSRTRYTRFVLLASAFFDISPLITPKRAPLTTPLSRCIRNLSRFRSCLFSRQKLINIRSIRADNRQVKR